MDEPTAANALRGASAADKHHMLHQNKEEPAFKKQKIADEDKPGPSSALSEDKSKLCDELISQAAYLLRKATLLRSTTDDPLAHGTLTEMAQEQSHERCTRVLQLHKQLDRLEIEHAKVQVMLEQIRRCNAHPFPAWDQSQQVEPGLVNEGPLVELSREGGGFVWPQYTNKFQMPKSPYVAHYERWLIPEPEVAPKVIVEQKEVLIRVRNTRNSSMTGTDAHATDADHNQPAEPSRPVLDPVVMKNSEGAWVQLRCWAGDCGGSHDFKSIQGFVNHRRTLHGIRHPSQLEAADTCGEEIALSEEMRQAYEESFSKGKPKRSRLEPGKSAVNYDGVAPSSSAIKDTETIYVLKLAPKNMKSAREAGLYQRNPYISTVHPFNRPDAGLPTRPIPEDDQDLSASFDGDVKRESPPLELSDIAQDLSGNSLSEVTACRSTPYLSAYLRKMASSSGGKTFDLATITKSMREAVAGVELGLSAYEDEDDDNMMAGGPVKNHVITKAPPKVPPDTQSQPKHRDSPRGFANLQHDGRTRTDGIGLLVAPNPSNPSTIAQTYGQPHVPKLNFAHSSPIFPHGGPSSSGLQSPNLPGLISDHESVAETDDETHDLRRVLLNAKRLRLEVEEDGDDDEMDEVMEVTKADCISHVGHGNA